MPDRIGNPSLLRSMNERLLLDHLWEHGKASRGELAAATGLSKPTVSAALSGLQSAGLVEHVGALSGRPGPTTAIYDVNVRAGLVAGIDIGRAWIRLALADLRGDFIGRGDVPNDAHSPEKLIAQVRELADQVAREAGVDWSEVDYIVIGSPGVVDEEAGRLELAFNLPGMDQPGLLGQLREALGEALVVENDINLAAIGEMARGAGHGVRNFVLISVGTGVGMGIVIDGELYSGGNSAAGEVAYLPAADLDVPTGGAWERGPTEETASAGSVVAMARAAGLTADSAKQVFEAAAGGDPAALSVVASEGRRLGGVITAVAAILDPELVVLTGGVGRNLEVMREAITARIDELGPLRPTVVGSSLGDGGILQGAVARALQVARELLFDRRATRPRSAAPDPVGARP